MPEVIAKAAAVQGTLRERPLPRLLQQLYRKQFTGHFAITDETRDENVVYLREGMPVHVCRPVDTDRLDNLLVEYGLVPADIVTQASAQVNGKDRLGDVLERMGALDKQKLAYILKTQVMRKLTRLFFVADGTYAVYVSAHGFGEGGDLPLMRVDPRTVIYPGIRAAYDLPRVTRELARLNGQRFRLAEVSSAFVAALGISAEDATVRALRKDWMTLEDLERVTSRQLEVRSVVLAMYYTDSLEREAIASSPTDSFAPQSTSSTRSSGTYRISKPFTESGAAFDIDSGSSSEMTGTAEAAGSAPAPAPAVVSVTSPPLAEVGAKPAPVAAPASAPTAKPTFAAGAGVAAPAVTAAARPSGTMPVLGAPAVALAPPPSAARPSGTIPVVQAPMAPAAPARVPAPGNGDGRGAASPAAGAPAARPPVWSAPRPAVKAAASGPPKPAAVPAPEGLRASIQEMTAKLDKSTHFEILGVGQTASADEVGTAFVRAARQFHPDRLTGAGLADLQPLAERILARINEAAMVLGNATRRAEYVSSLAAGSQVAQNLPTLLEAENLFLKGEVFLKKGDYPKAIEAFTGAGKGNPSEPQYQAYLAWARFEDPRARKEAIVRETLKTIEGVLKERPKFARGFYWEGQLWKFLNEASKAEQAFREAVRVDESFIEASRELRLIEMRRSKTAARPAKPGAKPEKSKGKFWKR